MIIRCTTILAVATLSWNALADEASRKAPPESKDMRKLFNGKDLAGWDGDTRLWSVKDGAIRGETTPEKRARGNTFLICKTAKLKDFELRLSFRCNATNNSGIQYRSKRLKSGRNKWVVGGYQHEIRNENSLPSVSGFIYDERGQAGRRGRMCLVGERAVWSKDKKKTVKEKLIDAEAFKKLFKLDDWNDVIIIAKGNHLRHYMNGRLIMDCVDNHPAALSEGVLALQLHAGKPMWVEFKDIRIKELK